MVRLFYQEFFRIALLALVASGMVLLAIDAILDKGVSGYNKLLALGIAIVCSVMFLQGRTKGAPLIDALREPLSQWKLMEGLFAAFAVVSGAISLMAPRPVTESRTGLVEQMLTGIYNNVQKILVGTERLEDGQAKIANELGIGEPSLAIANIGGRWGEENCAATMTLPCRTGL